MALEFHCLVMFIFFMIHMVCLDGFEKKINRNHEEIIELIKKNYSKEPREH